MDFFPLCRGQYSKLTKVPRIGGGGIHKLVESQTETTAM